MFILKIVGSGLTVIRRVEEAAIIRKDSALWAESFEFAAKAGLKKPNWIEVIPQRLDKDGGVLESELVMENGNREISDDRECTAILCESGANFLGEGDERPYGRAYTFLYQGDEVRIMTDSGFIIAEVA